MDSTTQQQKQKVVDAFNGIAGGYDSAALRFFPFAADNFVNLLKPAPGHKILDVAAGTGALAIACAQAVKPQGRVMAIDMSQAMLDKAEQNIRKTALHNIDLFDMDGEALDFRRNYFDAVVCSFGLFFMPNMLTALQEWVRVAKPGGTIMISSFSTSAFQPLRNMLVELLTEYEVELPNPVFSSDKLTDPQVCQSLFKQAGLQQITVHQKQLGYHLQTAEDWWSVLWNSGAGNILQLLDDGQREQFRIRHLQQVGELATEKGIWMNVEVLFTSGRVKE